MHLALSTGKTASRLAIFLLAACCAPTALAQNADIVSGSITTCNVKGNIAVTLPLLGTFNYPLPCVNQSQRAAAGTDDRTLTGDIDIGVTPMLDVVNLKAPHGQSGYTEAFHRSTRSGLTEVDEFDAVQGLLGMNGLRGGLRCSCSSDTLTVDCDAFTSIGTLMINGNPVSLPSNIPVNYAIPIANGSVRITLPILGNVVDVPVNGSLVLNEVVMTGAGTTHGIVEHNPVHLTLGGSLTVAGLGLAEVQINVIDAAKWETEYDSGHSYQYSPPQSRDWVNFPNP